MICQNVMLVLALDVDDVTLHKLIGSPTSVTNINETLKYDRILDLTKYISNPNVDLNQNF